MSSKDKGYYYAIAAVVVAIAIKLWSDFGPRLQYDLNEPPLLRPRVPLIGHLLGIKRYSHDYLSGLSRRTNNPIVTLPFFELHKVYLVLSPSVAQAVFRNKSLSFDPMVKDFITRKPWFSDMFKKALFEDGLQEQGMHILQQKLNGLDQKRISKVTFQETVRVLDSFPQDGFQTSNLWLWIRDVMTVSITSGLFGVKHNPFAVDSSLIQAIWDYEAGDISGDDSLMMLGPDNKNARMKIGSAIANYIQMKHNTGREDSTVSQVVSEYTAVQTNYGISPAELGQSWLLVVHALLMNTVPALYWCMAHVFSRPSLLNRMKEEVLAWGDLRCTYDGVYQVVEVDRINHCAPLMLSVVREVQRLISQGMILREVVEDCMVTDEIAARYHPGQKNTFLLKKGTTVMIPVANNMRNQDIWGADADDFDPDRFMGQQVEDMEIGSTTKEEAASLERLRRQAWYPFGGGKSLCPGRNLATTTMLSTLALLVASYDIDAVDGGPIKLPTSFEPSKMTVNTVKPHPKSDLNARITRNKVLEGASWVAKPVLDYSEVIEKVSVAQGSSSTVKKAN